MGKKMQIQRQQALSILTPQLLFYKMLTLVF